MKSVADLLFEASMLKHTRRAGFSFLGLGKESVAEHSFCVAFIGYIISLMVPEIDALRLISMCLIHDLAEARTGDLNYVHKKYVTADEKQAVSDAVRHIPFGGSMADLIDEFNAKETLESELAHDADQLAFILDLKSISDIGGKTPEQWLPVVQNRLKTKIGKRLSRGIMDTRWDAWWMADYKE